MPSEKDIFSAFFHFQYPQEITKDFFFFLKERGGEEQYVNPTEQKAEKGDVVFVGCEKINKGSYGAP